MILTYKIKHLLDLTDQLKKADRVAKFALRAKSWYSKSFLSSKQVKDIGLPSAISCQILKKYFRNKKIKKIAKRIVKEAKLQSCKIVLEDLTGIRKNKKHTKSFNGALNSWSFYQLKQFIEYKAKLQGVEVVYIDPRYTSKMCSKCGNLGDRKGKSFKCPLCGHVENADVNASFNIGQKHVAGVSRSPAQSAAGEGCTDKPKKLLRNDANFRTPRL